MNKGLEVIEAYHLFNLKPDEIEVLVHPQSIVHGMVEFRDGSVIAHLGAHDMRIPIAHASPIPTASTVRPNASISRNRSLTFEKPDLERFPALGWLGSAAHGSGATTVLNAANEIACGIRRRRIGFTGHSRRWWRRPLTRRRARASCANPAPSRMRLPLTIIRDRWRASSCPKSPQRHFSKLLANCRLGTRT
jgi:hypothetical protein